MRDGLTGHLEGADYPFGITDWHLPEGNNRCPFYWGPCEQSGHWVDGMLRCGLLLDDAYLLGKARLRTEHVLAHADPDGYLGLNVSRRSTRTSPRKTIASPGTNGRSDGHTSCSFER